MDLYVYYRGWRLDRLMGKDMLIAAMAEIDRLLRPRYN